MKRFLVFCLLTVAGTSAQAQANDSLILQAMKDELFRNMKELKYEGFQDPFYIAYSIKDVTSYSVVAMMGSILRSTQERNRTKNVRVLVGDYDFNDESLDNNSFSPPEPNEIELPLDDDYYGIRRSLWVTTDYIYKSAARQYKSNLELLEQKKQTISEMPHRSFAKKPAAQIIDRLPAIRFDQQNLEHYLQDLTAEFGQYPAIEHSSAYVIFTDGYNYFVNSEGTVSVTPVRRASLHIFAQRKSEEGETLQDQIVHHAFTPDGFPPTEQIRKQIHELCKYITSVPLRRFDDEYNGPVLITGGAVADLFARTLFSAKDALVASDLLPDPRGYRSSDQSSIETKIGKPVVPVTMTVRSVPLLKEFNGIALLGFYQIDDEGVVPEKETVVIEKGILRNLLNNRSSIKPSEIANGHAAGPAVIDVAIENGVTNDALKKMLIEEAKKQGAEHALIFSEGSNGARPAIATRISVADGKEEILRAPMLEFIDLKKLKDLVAATKTRTAFNFPFGTEQMASFIVPEAILIRDLEVKGGTTTFFKDEQFITSPLNK